MTRSTRILWGLFAPVFAAVLFVAGEFVLPRPDLLMNPSADPEAFAQMVTGSGFAFYAARGVVGAFLETVGLGCPLSVPGGQPRRAAHLLGRAD